jgi:hypothetical protein
VELLHARPQERPHPRGVLVGGEVRPGGVVLQGGAVGGGVVVDVLSPISERVDEHRVQLEGQLLSGSLVCAANKHKYSCDGLNLVSHSCNILVSVPPVGGHRVAVMVHIAGVHYAGGADGGRPPVEALEAEVAVAVSTDHAVQLCRAGRVPAARRAARLESWEG